MVEIKKRFKTTKKKTLNINVLLFILVFSLTMYGGFKLINVFLNTKLTEDVVIGYLFGNENIDLSKVFKNKNFFLNYTYGTDSFNEDVEEEVDLTTGDYLEDPKKEEVVNEPLIYLYNTHQTEEYQKDYLEPYSIKPTVMLVSYMLREYLNDLGIATIVETKEVKKELNRNGWKYGKSYLVSRSFLESAKKENASLKLYIDLHRDSGSHKATTTSCNGKDFARVLFVIGLEHDNYEANLTNAVVLNNKIEEKCSKLSRGILKKEGKGVNGKYNQDFDANVFLIEVGGQYNNIEEVKNTIELLSDVIFDYVKERT